MQDLFGTTITEEEYGTVHHPGGYIKSFRALSHYRKSESKTVRCSTCGHFLAKHNHGNSGSFNKCWHTGTGGWWGSDVAHFKVCDRWEVK